MYLKFLAKCFSSLMDLEYLEIFILLHRSDKKKKDGAFDVGDSREMGQATDWKERKKHPIQMEDGELRVSNI